MSNARVAMDSIREILRMRHEGGRSQREIARSSGLSAGAVNKVLRLAREVGLAWPLEPEVDEGELQKRLYGGLPERSRAAGGGRSTSRRCTRN